MVHWITEQRCHTLFEQFDGMLRDKEQKGEEQARSRLTSDQSGRPKHPVSPN